MLVAVPAGGAFACSKSTVQAHAQGSKGRQKGSCEAMQAGNPGVNTTVLTCAFDIAKLTDKLVCYFIVRGALFTFHLFADLVGQGLYHCHQQTS